MLWQNNGDNMKKQKEEKEAIGVVIAEIKKLTTTVDGGVSITFDVASHESELFKQLIDLKANNDLVYLTIVKK